MKMEDLGDMFVVEGMVKYIVTILQHFHFDLAD